MLSVRGRLLKERPRFCVRKRVMINVKVAKKAEDFGIERK